jgi:hypothetical protein
MLPLRCALQGRLPTDSGGKKAKKGVIVGQAFF